MTVAEAARKLEVSPSLVYSLVASGQLGCYRIGHGRGMIRISEGHITEYLGRSERGREAAPPPPAPVAPRNLRHIRLR